jgi:hypothetical protein
MGVKGVTSVPAAAAAAAAATGSLDELSLQSSLPVPPETGFDASLSESESSTDAARARITMSTAKMPPTSHTHTTARNASSTTAPTAPTAPTRAVLLDAERLGSTALNVRTPVPGLLLAGQDVAGAGVEAAAMSGLMAAIALEPGWSRCSRRGDRRLGWRRSDYDVYTFRFTPSRSPS